MSKVHKHIFSLAIALVLLAVGTGFFLSQHHSTSFVFAADSDLEVEFEKSKLFEQSNMLPGDEVIGRWFKVTNKSATTSYPLYFVAWKTGGSATTPVDFASVLNIKIKKDGDVDYVYNGSLKGLFDKSKNKTKHEDLDESDGVSLGTTLASSGEQKFYISAEFAESANNDYKNKEVIWDTILGFVGAATTEDVLAAVTGPRGSILGIATGADLLPSILGSLAALSTGLYLRHRSSVNQPHSS